MPWFSLHKADEGIIKVGGKGKILNKSRISIEVVVFVQKSWQKNMGPSRRPPLSGFSVPAKANIYINLCILGSRDVVLTVFFYKGDLDAQKVEWNKKVNDKANIYNSEIKVSCLSIQEKYLCREIASLFLCQ